MCHYTQIPLSASPSPSTALTPACSQSAAQMLVLASSCVFQCTASASYSGGVTLIPPIPQSLRANKFELAKLQILLSLLILHPLGLRAIIHKTIFTALSFPNSSRYSLLFSSSLSSRWSLVHHSSILQLPSPHSAFNYLRSLYVNHQERQHSLPSFASRTKRFLACSTLFRFQHQSYITHRLAFTY